MIAQVRRMTGVGALATLALAVLVFGCVFAVTAGPREALAARTQALRQTVAATPTMNQAITAQATWIQFIGAFGIVNSAPP
jgi:hypothetical protein